MNVYALNATPLNGTATLFGQGAAVSLIEADGRGHLVMHGGGQAALGAGAIGSGLIAVLGEAILDLSIAAAGSAYLVMHAIGQVASASLEALGSGLVIPWLGGFARMHATAGGIGRIAVTATSAAIASLTAIGRGLAATRGTGQAALDLTGFAGIPHPMAVPTTFTLAHASRRVVVPAAAGPILPPAAERIVHVSHEPRAITVAPERNQ